jgi:hypothetical protein
MKKLIAIVIIFTIALSACANPTAADVDASATPTAKSLYPSAKATPAPTPRLSPTEKRESVNADGKPLLYIGSFSGGSFEIEDSFIWLDTVVRNFNYKWQEQYEARIVDYGDATASDAYYRLNSEIISGQMPDMLITHNLPIDSYAKLGLLYDMSGWLNPEDFYTGPLNAMLTEDGKLYEISPLITVTSFYGLTKYLGKEGAMSLADIYAAWEKFNASGDKVFIAGLSNELICMLLVSGYEEQFVDRSAATCNFNSAEFIELLEFCKKLPAHPAELDVKAKLGLRGGDSSTAFEALDLSVRRALTVRNEEALLGVFGTQRFDGTLYMPHQQLMLGLNDADYRFIGYPGANTASVYFEFPFALSSKTPNIEVARIFVDELWESFTNQNSSGISMLHIKRSAVEAINKYYLKEWQDFSKMSDDIDIADNVLLWGNINFTGAPDYTLDDFAEFEELINAANVRVHNPITSYLPPLNTLQIGKYRELTAPLVSTFVNPILSEEIQSYFAGIQDVNRAATLIQSRYSVYLSEQG